MSGSLHNFWPTRKTQLKGVQSLTKALGVVRQAIPAPGSPTALSAAVQTAVPAAEPSMPLKLKPSL